MSRRRKKRKTLPRLRPEHLHDAGKFTEVVDQAAVMAPRYRSLTKRILRLQRELLDRLEDHNAFVTFIRLEADMNQRHLNITDFLVRWAFEEGRRAAQEEAAGERWRR